MQEHAAWPGPLSRFSLLLALALLLIPAVSGALALPHTWALLLAQFYYHRMGELESHSGALKDVLPHSSQVFKLGAH